MFGAGFKTNVVSVDVPLGRCGAQGSSSLILFCPSADFPTRDVSARKRQLDYFYRKRSDLVFRKKQHTHTHVRTVVKPNVGVVRN